MSFARRACPKQPAVFEPEALRAFQTYDWPGNIRELENAVVRAAAMCDETIREQDLPERIRCHQQTPLIVKQETLVEAEEEWPPLSEIEARYVAKVFSHTRGNKQAAARILQIDRKTLERMLKRHNIPTKLLRTPLRVA
jgi:DNA-binding NtrC family response regulator